MSEVGSPFGSVLVVRGEPIGGIGPLGATEWSAVVEELEVVSELASDVEFVVDVGVDSALVGELEEVELFHWVSSSVGPDLWDALDGVVSAVGPL